MERSERNDMTNVVDERRYIPAVRKNILIVEDEKELRLLLRMTLQDEYLLFEAEDGERAIQRLQSVSPDLIISDVIMPNMNGLELCNQIKNTNLTCHIPFILLSGRDTPDQQMAGYEVGADAYIAKPFHAAHLRIRVRKMLEQAEKMHQFFRNRLSWNVRDREDLSLTDQQFLSKILAIIQEKMDDTSLHTDQIEKILFLSKMQLYRKLKNLTGKTPGEFIKHIRLEHAAHLLKTTRLTVSEIFFRTGFNNQSYFFREFRKQYRSAPNVYRTTRNLHM